MATLKDIELQKSNLRIVGVGTDINGNRVIKLQLPASRSFSIQTNGNMTKAHRLLNGMKTVKDISKLSLSDIEDIGKEVANYIQKYGSVDQKKRLRIY